MKNKSWVLVANSAQARLFSLVTINQLQEFHDFLHPESRLHERELVDARPGRAFDSTSLHRHAMEPHSTQKEQEVELFAKNIANYLEEAHKSASFTRLYIIAGPLFLGILRKLLHPAIMQLVAKEIPKDLVRFNTAQILEEISL